MSEENLTSEGLRALAGCSPATLTRWIGKGIPHTRQPTGRGGAKMLIFPRRAAMDWIAQHANQTAARKAIALSGKSVGEADPATVQLLEPDEIDAEGLLPCLARMKKTERATFRLMSRLKEKGDISGATVLSERYVHESKTLAALEQAALNYRVRSGALVDRAAMQGVFGRVIISVKNAVLGVPSSAVPLLMPYIRDPEKAHDVFSILDRLCRNALQAASDKHSRPKTGQPTNP